MNCNAVILSSHAEISLLTTGCFDDLKEALDDVYLMYLWRVSIIGSSPNLLKGSVVPAHRPGLSELGYQSKLGLIMWNPVHSITLFEDA